MTDEELRRVLPAERLRSNPGADLGDRAVRGARERGSSAWRIQAGVALRYSELLRVRARGQQRPQFDPRGAFRRGREDLAEFQEFDREDALAFARACGALQLLAEQVRRRGR